ncbi:MAG: hypothetical protein ACREVX_13480 [Clostridium sp.]|uniref:hypothetical protein n=1 Tax=Clostridium sp. TaxID=1506 RepID=UPI003D6CA5E7
MDDKMFKLMEKMYIEFSSFKTDIKEMKQDLTSVKEDLTSVKEDLISVKEDVKALGVKVDKNTILLENLTSKVETTAEVQKSYMNQNEKAHDYIVERIGEKISVLELSTKDTSKDVKEMKSGLRMLK